jgi:hypothetical protein
MARKKKVRIIYDPSLEVEKRESFVSTKLGGEVSQIKKTIEGMPAGVKWLLAVLIGGFISALVELLIVLYFEVGFNTIEAVDNAFKVQLIIDAMLVTMMIIFIGLLIKESKS